MPEKPPKPESPHPYGYTREDGMSFFGLECRLYQTGWKWIERWKDKAKHRAAVLASIQRPHVKESRKEYRLKYRKTDSYKNWEKSRPWYAECRRKIAKRYNSSEHGKAWYEDYKGREHVKISRMERRSERRAKERVFCPLLNTINRAIYETARFYTKMTGVQFHVDHIIPVSRGGLHVPWNLNPIPWHENLRKHNKILTA